MVIQVQIGEKRESALLGFKGTSLHLVDPVSLEDYENNENIFVQMPLLKELYDRGYPLNSCNSIIKCGIADDFLVAKCGCGSRVIPLAHHCDLRTCSYCSKRRKRRLRRRFLPFLEGYTPNSLDSFYFLTISPANYSSLDHAYKDIRDTFTKFRRTKYIRERLKAGFYVIETKQSKDGSWNVHIHAICYGRRLDNNIRGKCKCCGQNLIKFDYLSKKYYCANRSCNSLDVDFKQHSKIVSLWRKASGKEVNIDIKRQNSMSFTLNYLLKYVSMQKEDFVDEANMAEFIVKTRNIRLVNAFGVFHKIPIPVKKDPYVCPVCEEEVEFIYDLDLVFSLQNPRPPPVVQEKFIIPEYIKV